MIMKLKNIILAISLLWVGETLYAQKEYKTNEEYYADAYVIPIEKVRVADIPNTDDKIRVAYIETDKKETRVTILYPLYWHRQWLTMTGFVIVDRETGDQYVQRGYGDGLPYDKLLMVNGYYGKCIYLTLVFPPLKKKVKTIDILDMGEGPDIELPNNILTVRNDFYNLSLIDYEKKDAKRKPQKYY